MKVIGTYGRWFDVVQVDGRPLSPRRSQRLINHSPDGFAWGYAGSGPAQLALAILLEAGLAEEQALRLYERFKFQFIASLPRRDFEFEIDLDAWCAARELEDARASDHRVGPATEAAR